jgi:hypothetical protein
MLILSAVVAGAALVACGGSSNKAASTAAPTQGQTGSTPAAQATTAQQPTSASNNSGGSNGSLADVPVYPGATKITSREYSGSDAGIPALGSNLNASDYTHVAYALYGTSDGAQTVIDWYKGKMSGWTDVGSFSGGSQGSISGFSAWTKEDGKAAAWISVTESDGTTSLAIWYGIP